MTLPEIRENLFPEDKMKVCTHAECTWTYVDYILNGQRNTESERAKAILDMCTRLAEINIEVNGIKNAELIKISEQLFEAA